jgi:hypothetical protein
LKTAFAEALNRPFEDISMENGNQALYHFTQEKKLAERLIQLLTWPRMPILWRLSIAIIQQQFSI